jgi:hypothetical protein
MIDPNFVALIAALLINVPTWLLMRESKRKAAAASREQEAAAGKVEDEITERVLTRARTEITELQALLDVERKERRADRDTFEKQIAQLHEQLNMRDRVILQMKSEITSLRHENGTIRAENESLRQTLETLTKGTEAK